MPAPPPRPPRTPPPPPAPRPGNARATRKAPHGVLEVDWPFFGEMCRALALKIFRDYDPDVYALETDNFVILPWDREVIIDGEIVMRPDYAAKLKELGG